MGKAWGAEGEPQGGCGGFPSAGGALSTGQDPSPRSKELWETFFHPSTVQEPHVSTRKCDYVVVPRLFRDRIVTKTSSIPLPQLISLNEPRRT